MQSRTVVWSVTNAAARKIRCILEERASGDFRLSVELEDNEVLSEVHYSPADALKRASALRARIDTGT
jgi:hypothetical protein